MLVTNQWPLKRAPHLTALVWVCVVWMCKRSFELVALCCFKRLMRLVFSLLLTTLFGDLWCHHGTICNVVIDYNGISLYIGHFYVCNVSDFTIHWFYFSGEWRRMHVSVNWVNIGISNVLTLVWRQAFTCMHAYILLWIGASKTHVWKILDRNIKWKYFKQIPRATYSAKCSPFCACLNFVIIYSKTLRWQNRGQ